ncbi:Inner kinetochore subunit CTF19 [Kluyveromyces marxianus]|nr:hypothetical protein C6P43_001917 [Kluyveromyces marxianus]KAG0678129.1 hypothetical protein C6P41_001144 [Kluyveromyces marxianus]
MDFTSSSGVGDSEANSNRSSSNSDGLSSHSDVVETDELKLIKLEEHKNQLLRQRAELLDQLSNTRVVEPRSIELDDKLLLTLLRRSQTSTGGVSSNSSSNNKNNKSTAQPLPRVLPSLNIEDRKKYLDMTLQDVVIECKNDVILLKKNGFEARFSLKLKEDSISQLDVNVNDYEIALEPLLRYVRATNNINIAMMGIIQFLRLKQLHSDMVGKIVDLGKFSSASGNTLGYKDVRVTFQIFWNLPSPYPETLILTNKTQEILDFFIHEYGIEQGITKYGSTFI